MRRRGGNDSEGDDVGGADFDAFAVEIAFVQHRYLYQMVETMPDFVMRSSKVISCTLCPRSASTCVVAPCIDRECPRAVQTVPSSSR